MAIITKTVYLEFLLSPSFEKQSNMISVISITGLFLFIYEIFYLLLFKHLNTNESIMSLSSPLIIIQFPTYSNTYDINVGKKDMISNDRQISQP